MSNLNCSGRLLLLLLVALAFFSSGGGVVPEVQWQVLTKLNYSSQIRLHPHILLLVTVPWSGETRSLMKELAHVVASNKARFGTLKLMVLYRNVERMLANALGSSDGIGIFYYHNSVSYKYQGRVRVQNILSSVHYMMSLSLDELPLKSLTTPEQLNDFIHSTDKAVILLEFCGWTRSLLAINKSMTESDFGKDYHGPDFNRENNGTHAAEDNTKVMEDDNLSCHNNNEFCGVPWPTQFTPFNVSLVKEADNTTLSAGKSCDLYEFQQFKGFLQKMITFAREFFLPSERLRFAVVSERSLLPLLSIEEPGPWSMTVHFAGCSNCSQVLKEIDDLRAVLQARSSPVLEARCFHLEDDPPGVEAALSARRPTMLLFVDRSSDSVQIRRESQEALDAFRELAKQSEMSNQIHGQANIRPDKTTETNRASWTTHKHPRLQTSPASQKLSGKDKMSIMIMNEGQQVTLENLVPDLQGRSVREILTYALKEKKELRLSKLAKDAGFQLLSKDFDIEVLESLPSHSEDQSYKDLGETPVEEADESAAIDKKQIQGVNFIKGHEEPPVPSDVNYIMLKDEENSLDKSSMSSVEPQHRHSTKSRYLEIDENEQSKDFIGSFLFLDGEYRLLETLTGGSMIPSVVIIDPISQNHYVLTEQLIFNYSSLSVFANDFLAGKLSPYLQSADVVPSSRSSQRPPFVNLDFHETDSIPQVTTHTFSELVLGNNSDPRKSGHWGRNVLVLFSNSWCGFCQRMELVVREVYRGVKGYANMKINSSKEKLMLTVILMLLCADSDRWLRCVAGYVADDALKLPLIYMMDCTRNDCGWIVKTIPQREDYPLLILFPAERKNNTVSYEGDVEVSGIIKFLSAHGTHVTDLIVDKSFLRDQSSVTEGQQIRTMHHKVLLKDSLQNVAAVKYQINVPLHGDPHERPQLIAGCILTATEKLLDVHPFDESKILLVKADQSTGFQGLIFNKHISWDSLEDLEGGFELLKRAPLSFGGPVMMNGMPLVALTNKFVEEQSFEVVPNVYFVDQLGTSGLLEKIRVGNQTVDDYWFFLGYSSWGWEQLFNEIAQGAWNVSKGNMEQLEWP
ncbi:upf0301 protein ct0663 [Phtheirospermum japonicum]|uniref:Upf0301 protein ct0663 n=1 Tax=Phtheirospermum japonicum TaxID=374723 RepID=A0A830B5Z0_9LAMI|nr:upf0301 protein ct0663 [Phtheirospermum japonicum]